VTDAFEAVARRLLKSLGYPDIPIIVTPAPVVYLDEADIQQRIDTLLDRISASFEAPRAP
jgi:hypothetical protein